jgi:hypothetical protein
MKTDPVTFAKVLESGPFSRAHVSQADRRQRCEEADSEVAHACQRRVSSHRTYMPIAVQSHGG